MRQSLEKMLWSDTPHNKADNVSAVVGAAFLAISLIVII